MGSEAVKPLGGVCEAPSDAVVALSSDDVIAQSVAASVPKVEAAAGKKPAQLDGTPNADSAANASAVSAQAPITGTTRAVLTSTWSTATSRGRVMKAWVKTGRPPAESGRNDSVKKTPHNLKAVYENPGENSPNCGFDPGVP